MVFEFQCSIAFSESNTPLKSIAQIAKFINRSCDVR